jgi:PAS domain S-box-containing protein
MTCDTYGATKQRLRAEAIYQTLIDISSAVNSTYDLRELFQTIHRSLGQIIDVSNFFIGIVDPRNRTIYFPFFQDEKDEVFDPIYQFRENNSLSGEVIQLGKPLLLKRADLEERAGGRRIVGTTPLIWLGVPLIIKGEVRGVMAVQSYINADQFDQNDLEILTSISHQIAVAIDRKMASDILRASEERFRGFVEGTDDLVVQMDKEGVISYCNHTARKILGLSAEECIGKPIFDFIHPEEIERFLDVYMQLLSRRRMNVSVENRLVNRRTGEACPLHWTINGQYDVQGQSVVVNAIARDLTDQKRAEEERLKVQKLESIGVMSGGIAHDFNNLLSVVMGNLDLLRGGGTLSEKDHSFINQARQACLRAKELTWRLITFSKGDTPHLLPGNLGDVVGDCVRRAQGNSSTPIDLEVAGDLWPVLFDAFQVGHAIDNLLNNAIEAVVEGGDIRVRLSNCPADTAGLQDGEVPSPIDGRAVQLLIADTGIGIPEVHRQRIFDPYFSTKSRGAQKGVGLGLATTYTIVRKHHGEIRVWSEAEKGTDVRVFFPAIVPLPEDRGEWQSR